MVFTLEQKTFLIENVFRVRFLRYTYNRGKWYTGCLKIASTKKKLWHLEALRNPKDQFLIFLNKGIK
jgi:hypothetical protein